MRGGVVVRFFIKILENKKPDKLPNYFPNITKREKFCEFLPF